MKPQYFDVGQDLPEHLAERTRLVNRRSQRLQNEFVLFRLHHAMRVHHNPAVDVAITMSNRLRIPLLVYLALPESYPNASDRHHSSIIDGVRQLQRQFYQRGIEYAFHLERRGHRGGHLRELSERAGVVVTEELPVEPLGTRTEKLASTIDVLTLCWKLEY
jgi:deoxyribodipyrimidine photolyase